MKRRKVEELEPAVTAAKAVAKGIQELYDSDSFLDLNVYCGLDQDPVSVHLLVISAVSPFLKELFLRHHDVSDNNGDRSLILPDVSRTDFENFVRQIYNELSSSSYSISISCDISNVLRLSEFEVKEFIEDDESSDSDAEEDSEDVEDIDGFQEEEMKTRKRRKGINKIKRETKQEMESKRLNSLKTIIPKNECSRNMDPNSERDSFKRIFKHNFKVSDQLEPLRSNQGHLIVDFTYCFKKSRAAKPGTFFEEVKSKEVIGIIALKQHKTEKSFSPNEYYCQGSTLISSLMNLNDEKTINGALKVLEVCRRFYGQSWSDLLSRHMLFGDAVNVLKKPTSKTDQIAAEYQEKNHSADDLSRILEDYQKQLSTYEESQTPHVKDLLICPPILDDVPIQMVNSIPWEDITNIALLTKSKDSKNYVGHSLLENPYRNNLSIKEYGRGTAFVVKLIGIILKFEMSDFARTLHLETHFERYELINQHILALTSLVENSSSEQQCNFCGQIFPGSTHAERYAFQLHVKTHQDMKFVCKECGSIFNSDLGLRRHSKVHTSNYTPCPVCKIPLTSTANLERHMKRYHDEEGGNRNAFMCETCGSGFPTKTHWQRHQTRHKSYNCDICKLEVIGLPEFRRHMSRKHSGQWKCEECDAAFNTNTRLKIHFETKHVPDNIKRYQCQYCNKGFTSQGKLNQHSINVHIKSRPFTCRYGCGAGYNDPSNRRCHERKKHGEVFVAAPSTVSIASQAVAQANLTQ